MPGRVCRALENQYVNVLAHPTGRLIGERVPYDVDIEAVLTAARRHGKALEINKLRAWARKPAPAARRRMAARATR